MPIAVKKDRILSSKVLFRIKAIKEGDCVAASAAAITAIIKDPQ